MPVPETLVIEMPAETFVIEMPAEIQRDACKHATSEGSSTERRGTKHLRTKDCGELVLTLLICTEVPMPPLPVPSFSIWSGRQPNTRNKMPRMGRA